MFDIESSPHTFIFILFAVLGIALAGCDSDKGMQDVDGVTPSEVCKGELTEPNCEQCCLKAGATEHDYEPIDDGDPRCTCVTPM